MSETTAMVVIDPERALADASARRQIVDSMRTQNILRAGIDYGVIPGSEKPTLLKPGAERLCSAFGLNPQFELINAVERRDPDNPLFHYQYRCRLIHIESGLEFATGIGSCNSMEAQHRWRNAERTCPECGKTAIIKGKPEYGGGWLCFKKMGGCGAKFAIDDPAITEQIVGKIPNDDVFSLVNTIDKKAQKRSLIAAVLIGANASEHFTQDVEELPGFGGGNVVDAEYTVIDTSTGEIQRPVPTAPASKPVQQPAHERRISGPAVGEKPLPFGKDYARVEAFCKRMASAFGVSAKEIALVLGVNTFKEYTGSEQDAEKAVSAWVLKEPEQVAAAAPDTTSELDRVFGKPAGLDVADDHRYQCDSVRLQKERGANNFSYVLHAVNSDTIIHVYVGDAFREAGLNPDAWKQFGHGHVEQFNPPLEVIAKRDNGKWAIERIDVPASVGMPA